MSKIEEVIVKVWDMSKASQDPIVRQNTLLWAKEELEKICQECEYDPQAAEFDWFLRHGWLPPAEVERLKIECQAPGWITCITSCTNPEWHGQGYFEPKPDDGRLLMEKELQEVYIDSMPVQMTVGAEWLAIDLVFGFNKIARKIIEAQDAKTSIIKDAECQARVERIFRKLELYSRQPMIYREAGSEPMRGIFEDDWQALKEQEGVKDGENEDDC